MSVYSFFSDRGLIAMERHNTFATQDSTALFYRYRPAKNGSSGKAVVLFHRGHEHSGRMICFWPTN